MKNLKKLLAVVLVIAMAFSLMAVASAAGLSDYADADSVAQKEAVEVMINAGIMTGDGTGSWNPTGTFTREQAAKVLTYLMIGKTAADLLKTSVSSFKDVAATRWSAPYIEYGVSRGIIAGTGDGTFAPDAPITGTAFAKMMLMAVGYGKNGEYVGSNWEINVLTDALRLGIFTLNVDYSAPATREQVAQYALNAMKVPYVVYSKDKEDYEDKAGADDIATDVYRGLNRVSGTVNGVYGYTWKNAAGTAFSSFYAAETVLGTSYNGTKISDLVNPLSLKYKASLDTAVKFFYNGAEITATADGAAPALYVANNVLYDGDGDADSSDDSEYAPPVGSIVNLIDTNFNGKADKVSIIVKTVDKVTGAVVTRTQLGVNQVSIPGVTAGYVDAKTVSYPADLANGDVVLKVTIDGVTQIEKAKATATAVRYTSKSAAGVYTVGGVGYSVSGLPDVVNLSGMTLGTSYVIYTDNDGGYAVAYGSAAPAQAQYCAVLDTNTVSAIGQTDVYQAQILKADGTVAIVTVAEDWSAHEGSLISYSVVPGTDMLTFGAAADTADDGAITNKSFKFRAGGTDVATSATIFLVRYGAGTPASPFTYSAYTGYSAVPTLADTTIQYFATDSKAAIVYVDQGTPGASTSIVYLLSADYGVGTAGGVNYREYAAIVDGVIGTVKTIQDRTTDDLASFFADGAGCMYTSVTIPGSGIIGQGQADDYAPVYTKETAEAVANPLGEGVISIGDTVYTYSDTTVVYLIENFAEGVQTVTETTVSALAVGNEVNFTTVPGTTALTAIYRWVPIP